MIDGFCGLKLKILNVVDDNTKVCIGQFAASTIAGFHRQLRKVNKKRSVLPSDKVLMTLMYLATTDASKKWTIVKRDWSEIIDQLDRIKLEI